MALIGVGPIVDRIKLILETYLNTEVDRIDTAEDALAPSGVTEADFTTPTVADDDIQRFSDDRRAEPNARLVIVPQASSDPQAFRHLGAGTGNPIVDRTHDLQILVKCASRGKPTGEAESWGETGAWRRASRISTAVDVVISRYPRMDVPGASPAVAALQGATMLSESIDRLSDEDVEDTTVVGFAVNVTVRLRRTR